MLAFERTLLAHRIGSYRIVSYHIVSYCRVSIERASFFHFSLNGPITIAIRARFEYDSTTIRLRFGDNTLRDAYDSSTIQHSTRSYVLSSNNEHVNSFAML